MYIGANVETDLGKLGVDLNLIGRCEDAPQMLRYLSALVLDYGCAVLSKGFAADGTGRLELEFNRVACIDVYCLFIALGIELDAVSHFKLTMFCQCTIQCPEGFGLRTARVVLALRCPQNAGIEKTGEISLLLRASVISKLI